jgi:Spy/CpxP family protein refolding chaperone
MSAAKESAMRTSRWLGRLGIVLLALAGAATAAPAEHRRKHERPPLDELLERHAGRLGLDAETLAKIRAVEDASHPEHERLADALHALRREMRERLGEDAPDRDAVMQLADRIGAAETALDKHRLATLLEIRALLSPAQRQELRRIFEERRRERHATRRRADEPPAP